LLAILYNVNNSGNDMCACEKERYDSFFKLIQLLFIDDVIFKKNAFDFERKKMKCIFNLRTPN